MIGDKEVRNQGLRKKVTKNNTIEKIIRVFKDLFSDIYVGENKVPISYSSYKDIMNKDIVNVVPSMEFTCDGITYDIDRKLTIKSHAPAPYNFNFTLYIQTLNLTMMSEVIDQILPFFNPYVIIKVKDKTGSMIINYLEVLLENVSWEDDFIVDPVKNKKIILTTLGFVVKTYFYVDVKDLESIYKSETDIIINKTIDF